MFQVPVQVTHGDILTNFRVSARGAWLCWNVPQPSAWMQHFWHCLLTLLTQFTLSWSSLEALLCPPYLSPFQSGFHPTTIGRQPQLAPIQIQISSHTTTPRKKPSSVLVTLQSGTHSGGQPPHTSGPAVVVAKQHSNLHQRTFPHINAPTFVATGQTS